MGFKTASRMSLICLCLGAAAAQAAEAPTSSFGKTTLEFADGLYARKMYGPAAEEYDKFMRENASSPELASAVFRHADCHYFLKQYTEAIPLFKRFMESYPQDERLMLALFRLGSARFFSGQTAASIRIFNRLIRDAGQADLKSASYYYVAKAYEKRQRPDKAQAALTMLLKQFPDTVYAVYGALLSGDLHEKKHFFGEAINAYEFAASKKDPPEVAIEARFKIGEIHFNLKEYAQARQVYETLLNNSMPPAASASREVSDNAHTLKEKALLGLFYCDYYLQDLQKAKETLEKNRPLIDQYLQKGDIYYLMAHLLAQAKEYDAAISFLDQVVASAKPADPLATRAVFKKAAVLSEKGQNDEALVLVQGLLDKNVKEKDRALYEKAGLLRLLNRHPEALQVYATVIKTYPQTRFARMSLFQTAQLVEKQGDFALAWETYSKYRKQYPEGDDSERAALELIQLDIQAKNFTRAEAEAAAFGQEFPKSPQVEEAAYSRAIALTGLRRYPEAAEAFLVFAKERPGSKHFGEALYGAAASFESADLSAKAIECYERFAREVPSHPLAAEALPHLGYLYISNNQPQKARALYEDLLARIPEFKLDADAIFWLVRNLLDSGDYEAMRKTLELLPRRFPGTDFSHEIHFFNGESAMGLKDYKKALAEYAEAIKLKPKGTFAGSAHLGSGIARLMLKDRPGAEASFKDALSFDQEPSVALRARFEMANLFLADGRLDEASKAFMLVAILYEDSKYVPASLYKAGECFLKIDRPEEAQKAFAELRQRFPANEWALKAKNFTGDTKKK